MNLIYVHHDTDGCSYSNETPIPFEYESKDKFISYISEILKNKNWLYGGGYIELFENFCVSKKDMGRDI